MNKTKQLVSGGVLTALVLVLQFLAVYLRGVFPVFAPSLVLIPIVIGAALGGVKLSAWLGLVFAGAVFISGDANSFLAVDIAGTIITVVAKGVLCGVMAGLSYRLLFRKNKYVAIVVSAIVCPVINSGVFACGCFIFFMDTLTQWGTAMGFENALSYLFLGMIGVNFLFELGLNLVLSPAVLRLINIKEIKGLEK